MTSTSDAQPEAAPLVAVVTPVYNGAPYLAATMACVQAQTYSNVVHVVLDNASRDATPDIIAAARADAGPVPILAHKNDTTLPQVANWNAAMALVPPEARYVKLLCADDLMRADAIARMVEIAERNPGVTLVSAVDVYDDEVRPHGFAPADAVYRSRDAIRRLLSGEITWFAFPHLFFRAEAVDLQAPFDPTTLPAPDADLALRLLQKGDLAFLADPLLYTRHHAATETAKVGGNRVFILSALKRVMKFGPDVMSPDEMRRCRDGALRMLHRHILLARARGDHRFVAEACDGLAALGLEAGAIDYARAIGTWPADRLDRLARNRRQRADLPPSRITEAEFLGRTAHPA